MAQRSSFSVEIVQVFDFPAAEAAVFLFIVVVVIVVAAIVVVADVVVSW